MSELYFGIDAAQNKHVHVNGICYTNEELGEYLVAREDLLLAYKAACIQKQERLDAHKSAMRALQDRVNELKDEVAALGAENKLLLNLVRDAVEDETEFETEWNMSARQALEDKK